MDVSNRDFKGIWIPREIYEAQGISWTAKILFLEIDSFTKQGKDCFMSNEYLADFLGISQTQVSKHISLLINAGWIRQVGFDGRKRYLKSCLEVNFNPGFNKTSSLGNEKLQVTLEENHNHTNTINNSSINTNKKGGPSSDFLNNISFSKGKKSKEEGSAAAAGHHEPETIDPNKFIEAFNAIAGRKFRLNDQIRKALIERVKDYTKSEIFQAIKNAHKDEYHIETGFLHLTPEFMLRPDKLEKFLNVLPLGKTNTRSTEGEPFQIGQKYNANG
jgi:DNA-binding Lrp family transcriptional regulator